MYFKFDLLVFICKHKLLSLIFYTLTYCIIAFLIYFYYYNNFDSWYYVYSMLQFSGGGKKEHLVLDLSNDEVPLFSILHGFKSVIS